MGAQLVVGIPLGTIYWSSPYPTVTTTCWIERPQCLPYWINLNRPRLSLDLDQPRYWEPLLLDFTNPKSVGNLSRRKKQHIDDHITK